MLVVDDNEDAAEPLAMLLRLNGEDSHAVHDGTEALRAMEGTRPEIAFFDIGMPKVNGYELCRRIREQSWGKNITLVALTSWGQEEDRRRTKDAGFDAHLVKPVDFDEVMKLLRSFDSHSGPTTKGIVIQALPRANQNGERLLTFSVPPFASVGPLKHCRYYSANRRATSWRWLRNPTRAPASQRLSVPGSIPRCFANRSCDHPSARRFALRRPATVPS